jgi:endogenous inhibitor of DNA gyrase (YacG/DUF329 family)
MASPHCPICKAVLKAEMRAHNPFCSARCKSIDFGRWLSESYRVPVEDSENEAPEEPPPPKPIGDA